MREVYLFTNSINGKLYVGKTSQGFAERLKEHLYNAFQSRLNGHFYNALRKYGVEAFSHRILETCDTEAQLNLKEAFWILEFNAWLPQFGYNKTFGGDGNSPTPETRRKLSVANTGRRQTLEDRQKKSKARLGIRYSEETLLRMKEARNKRGPVSEETRLRMAESHTDPSVETREKMRCARLGKKVSEETRMKMAESAKLRWAKKAAS